jgi:hydrogenase expression/formation protein HypD
VKYLDEYRDREVAAGLARRIAETVTRPWVLMEVCGGQTHSIVRYGIDRMMPDELELVHPA